MPQSSDPYQNFNALEQAAYQLSSCTDQLFQQIKQQQAIAGVIDKIRSSNNLATILKTTATEVRQLLNSDRVCVFRFFPDSGFDEGEFIAEDIAEGISPVLTEQVYDHCFGSQFAAYYAQGRMQVVADIYDANLSDCHIEILEQFQVRANLIVPVLKDEELWGLLCIHQCNNPRRWQLPEIEFIQKIADYFAIALQQSEQQEQIAQQATLIAKAQAQEKALKRQQSLVKITNRIRHSFDWTIVCQTAVDEAKQILEVDRVTAYRFNEDWSGEFLFESCSEGLEALAEILPDINDTYLMDNEGGCYRNKQTVAVDDIYKAGYTECYIQLLERLQAKAYAIAPIFEEEKLWGFLAAYQSKTRQWQTNEVELLAQIGEQLGIALQQTSYINRIQAQSKELQQTLQNLQEFQVQLIQNEKMASLGQLVAGIAHEINNPINFIHGNVNHIKHYTADVMEFLALYQEIYPDPDPRIVAAAEKLDIEFIQTDFPKIIDSMNLGTNRIQKIVSSLRNFSRVDESEFKVIDIHEGIESTLLILKHRLKDPSGKLNVQITRNYGKLPMVECYPSQLNQVFMNILANAIDAFDNNNSNTDKDDSSQPHQIEIQSQVVNDNWIKISITDNGVGMSEAILKQVFNPFFTTKEIGKGTGMGLPISYTIITEKHSGRLECVSQPGQGTQFNIYIPIKQ